MRRLIVSTLERVCGIIDRLPFAVGARTRLGCPRGLALWSSKLDQRWHTNVWHEPDQVPDA